jgi:hypothetical protein
MRAEFQHSKRIGVAVVNAYADVDQGRVPSGKTGSGDRLQKDPEVCTRTGIQRVHQKGVRGSGRQRATLSGGRSISSRRRRASALRCTPGWGMYPESLAAPQLDDGSFVRISDVHLDVPLYWQCWKLESSMVTAVPDAVRSAAGSLRRHRTLKLPGPR